MTIATDRKDSTPQCGRRLLRCEIFNLTYDDFGSKPPDAVRSGRRAISAVPPAADLPLIAAVTVAIIGMILLVLAMLADRFLIDVTFDASRGYVATHPNLPQPVIALSLTVLRARLGAQLGWERLQLKLDPTARAQRDERRGGGERARHTRPV